MSTTVAGTAGAAGASTTVSSTGASVSAGASPQAIIPTIASIAMLNFKCFILIILVNITASG
jgi:hypothetical protein